MCQSSSVSSKVLVFIQMTEICKALCSVLKVSACYVEVRFKTRLHCSGDVKILASTLVAMANLCFCCLASIFVRSLRWVPFQHVWFWTYEGSLFVSGVSRHRTGVMTWSVEVNAFFKHLLKPCSQLPHPLRLSVGLHPAVSVSLSGVAGRWAPGWRWPRLPNRPLSRLFGKPCWPPVLRL